MTGNLRLRFWLALVLAAVSAALVALALAEPTWIEQLVGVGSTGDNGSGEYEWLVASVPATVAVLAGWQARREWGRALAVAPVSKR